MTSVVPSCSEIEHWGIFVPRFSLPLELSPFSYGILNQGHVGPAPHVAKDITQSRGGGLGILSHREASPNGWPLPG